MQKPQKQPLIYMLHSANLFGTERMAMETLIVFQDEYHPIIICPPGPLEAVAAQYGIEVHVFRSTLDLGKKISRILRSHRRLVAFTTSIKQSAWLLALNVVCRRKIAHVHMVHGGASDRQSYGSKSIFNYTRTLQGAVSVFVKDRLIAHGVRRELIRVMPNFLSLRTQQGISARKPFLRDGARKGLVISRLVVSKRVDLLLDALELDDGLRKLDITIYGLGGQRKILQRRAESNDLPISFPGFSDDLRHQMSEYDFLIHLCPTEPFGMVILEAGVAGIPVVVPDSGGVASIVKDGVTGIKFQTENADSLAAALRKIMHAPVETLNGLASRARQEVKSNYDCAAGLATYRQVLAEIGDFAPRDQPQHLSTKP